MTTAPEAPATDAAAATVVPSYIRDAWWTPDLGPGAGKGAEVRDASTGELLAVVNADGLDLAGMVQHARTVGQRELGALTIH
jgi:oxepin-CoA hydrolase/3-oxo-5,6-dehydrosuberyl-CoA semialdehyde dehydrogenase